MIWVCALIGSIWFNELQNDLGLIPKVSVHTNDELSKYTSTFLRCRWLFTHILFMNIPTTPHIYIYTIRSHFSHYEFSGSQWEFVTISFFKMQPMRIRQKHSFAAIEFPGVRVSSFLSKNITRALKHRCFIVAPLLMSRCFIIAPFLMSPGARH
jgi:hypothetical protein